MDCSTPTNQSIRHTNRTRGARGAQNIHIEDDCHFSWLSQWKDKFCSPRSWRVKHLLLLTVILIIISKCHSDLSFSPFLLLSLSQFKTPPSNTCPVLTPQMEIDYKNPWIIFKFLLFFNIHWTLLKNYWYIWSGCAAMNLPFMVSEKEVKTQ